MIFFRVMDIFLYKTRQRSVEPPIFFPEFKEFFYIEDRRRFNFFKTPKGNK